MRLPRDVSGGQLGRALGKLGCILARQKGSHLRYTTQQGGTHHVTIPGHSPKKRHVARYPERCGCASRLEHGGIVAATGFIGLQQDGLKTVLIPKAEIEFASGRRCARRMGEPRAIGQEQG